MTLGGLALAVGILVDDATVEIENIHRNLGMGKPMVDAILDGAQQIAVPAFVSTLCICIVFVPVIFLTGAASYLFTPLALAVVFAMMASYMLSRTLVPTMVRYLLRGEATAIRTTRRVEDRARASSARIHHGFQARFERMRGALSGICWAPRWRIVGWWPPASSLICAPALALVPFIGTDFFPQVDAGQIRLHVRAPAGTRIEETERYFAQVEDTIRADHSRRRAVATCSTTSACRTAGINIALSDSATIGSFDGEILVSLRPASTRSTWDYIRELRERLNREFPGADVLLPAGRYRRPDSELRTARSRSTCR